MPVTTRLEIVSPDKVVYSEDVCMVIVRSTGGELGILPKHAPLVAGLVPHAIRVSFEGKRDEQLIACAGGFIEVTPDKVTIMAVAAEDPIDIDINRAQRAMERAKERLAALQNTSDPVVKKSIDKVRAEFALRRAMARLQATGTKFD